MIRNQILNLLILRRTTRVTRISKSTSFEITSNLRNLLM
jgi:hypothetical protein